MLARESLLFAFMFFDERDRSWKYVLERQETSRLSPEPCSCATMPVAAVIKPPKRNLSRPLRKGFD